MTVAVGRLAAFSAQELVDGQPRLAALDVPEGHVHPADGIVQDRAVPPVGAIVAGLPGVIDPVGRLAHQERLQVSLHRGNHQVRPLREGGASVAVKAVLVGEDLHNHQTQSSRSGGDHLDVPDPGRGRSPGPFLHQRPGFEFLRGDDTGERAGSQATQKSTSVHFSSPSHQDTLLNPRAVVDWTQDRCGQSHAE